MAIRALDSTLTHYPNFPTLPQMTSHKIAARFYVWEEFYESGELGKP